MHTYISYQIVQKLQMLPNNNIIIPNTKRIIFMIIAGGIFVTNSWAYFSDPVKQLCLAVVMLVLFVGKFYVGEKLKLEKTATALCYLGIAAGGFLTYSVVKVYLNG